MTDKVDYYKDKLENLLKNKEVSDSLFNYYEEKATELLSYLFFTYFKDEKIVERMYLKYKYVKEQKDIPTYYKNALDEIMRVVDLDSFCCLIEHEYIKQVEKLEKELPKEHMYEKEFFLLNKEVRILIRKLKKERDFRNNERIYLKENMNNLTNKILFLGNTLFYLLCLFFMYEIGLTVETLSLSILIFISFNLFHSLGKYFEKIRFKKIIGKIIKQKIWFKGIRFISFVYFSLFTIFSIGCSIVTMGGMHKHIGQVLKNDNEIYGVLVLSTLFSLSMIRYFRQGVYESRYALYQKIKNMISKKELYLFIKVQKRPNK